MSSKKTAECTIKNAMGLHVRPAGLFAQTATKFTSQIQVEKDGETINGKSSLSLLMLSAGQGSILKITATGEDAIAATEALVNLIESNFGE